MKILKNYIFPLLIGSLVYTVFFKTTAEADVKKSYQEYLNGKAIFIDVREQSEVSEGMVKGAMWLPLSSMERDKVEFIRKIKKLSDGKNLYLYCRSGKRVSVVQARLKDAGINSFNLGGFDSLVEQKLPTQTGPR